MKKQRQALPPRFVIAPVADLTAAEWNYKVQNTFTQGKLVENIRRNGQLETIIVRELPKGKFEVVNGNHRLSAFITLGVESVTVCNLGKITDATARRIAIETNETNFARDDLRFAAVLTDLLREFESVELLATLPFTDAELQNALMPQTFQFGESGAKEARTKKLEVRFTVTDEQAAQIATAMLITGLESDTPLFMQAITALLSINQK